MPSALCCHPLPVSGISNGSVFIGDGCDKEGDDVKFKTNRIVRSISRDITHEAYAIHIDTSIHANSCQFMKSVGYSWIAF